MKEIDKSFSGVVDYIQSDTEKAKKLALRLIDEYDHAKREIVSLKIKLDQAESSKSSSLAALHHVGSHMELPGKNFMIVTPSKVYDIGPVDITVKNNILQ